MEFYHIRCLSTFVDCIPGSSVCKCKCKSRIRLKRNLKTSMLIISKGTSRPNPESSVLICIPMGIPIPVGLQYRSEIECNHLLK